MGKRKPAPAGPPPNRSAHRPAAYEAGRLVREEGVVTTCPGCETVVDPADTELVETKVDRLILRLALVDDPSAEPLQVGVENPELLPGGAAIAVPADHPHAGQRVELPMGGRVAPVVPAQPAEPTLLVAAHDVAAWQLARALGLSPNSPVLDIVGTVRMPGPLDGLPRYAACMGTLTPDHDVLDARFLAAVWPFAVAGWPDLDPIAIAEAAASTTAIASPTSFDRRVLHSAILGLALAGAVPFGHVAVVDSQAIGGTSVVEEDLVGMVRTEAPAAIRAALVSDQPGRLLQQLAAPTLAPGDN